MILMKELSIIIKGKTVFALILLQVFETHPVTDPLPPDVMITF